MLPGFSRHTLNWVFTATAALLLPALLPATQAAAARTVTVAACPAAGFVSQHFHSGHNGVDIANGVGTPIHAVGDGEVTISGFEPGYGQWIRVLHPDGRISEYGHMVRRDVSVGDRVAAGQQIALMGSEGQSTGPHLHLRIWGDRSASYGIDPEAYLAEHGVVLPCTPGSAPRPEPMVYPAESGRVVSARSADGRLEVFAAGADGIHHAWQQEANGDWSEWESLGGPGNAELAIAPNADGRLELLAINGDTFQHRWQLRPSGGWSGWETFGGGGRDTAAGVNTDGRIEVYASGPTGLFHRYQTAPNGGWSGWESAGGGPADSRVQMEKSSDGRLEVFALSGAGFQHRYQTTPNGGWSSWSGFGEGGHDLTVDHNADGRLEVFASGPAGVFHKYQTDTAGWSGWEPMGGLADSQLTSERTPDGRVEVFAMNGTTATHIWQTAVNAPYSDWAPFGTGGTEVIAATNADGRIEVFGTNPTGVFHKWQTGFATWSEWNWLNSSAGPGVD
ncbi:M23 family metallopeptidase [Streptomyces sp. NBC_01754]|uniref:peptidoglycan DD-metalloendopeptidase family protein n=1 Tax=Streptomyces sp. NBC_01754 TaxID=2975930 RepID=UPI002DDB54BA|nr:peptidoglycan DD-metalloendopeptidase family protein [Streptomyces sp. NBC_01754]WSC95563.1 M23 family metallopeptidase [Streptomyces sp. NBC_01754]